MWLKMIQNSNKLNISLRDLCSSFNTFRDVKVREHNDYNVNK
jgi:hypothetical protein